MERIYGPIASKLTMAQREPLWTEFVKQEETLAQQALVKALQDSIHALFNNAEFLQLLNQCPVVKMRNHYLMRRVNTVLIEWKIKFFHVVNLETLFIKVMCDIDGHGKPVVIDYGANLCLLQKGEADVKAWPGLASKETIIEAFDNFLKENGYAAPEETAVVVPVHELGAIKPRFKVKPLVWIPHENYSDMFSAKAGTNPLVFSFTSVKYKDGNWNLAVITNIDVTPESSDETISPRAGYSSFDDAKAAAEQFIMDAFNDLMVTTET